MHTSHPNLIGINQTSYFCIYGGLIIGLLPPPLPKTLSGNQRCICIRAVELGCFFTSAMLFTAISRQIGQLYGDESDGEWTDTGRNEWSPGSFSLRMVALGRARCKMAAGTKRQLRLNFNNSQVSVLLAPASYSESWVRYQVMGSSSMFVCSGWKFSSISHV